MIKPKRKLPSMTALPAFEAAARSLSFTKAAQELCVTQAAISRQIASLERGFGAKLFIRSHRKLELTAEGQLLQHSTSIALDLIEKVTRELHVKQQKNLLTIAADTSMAYRWLLPRFENFHNSHPDIPVNIRACDHEEDCFQPDADVILLYGDGYWPGYDATLILEEEIYPVCHPEFYEQHSITSIEELSDFLLLDLQAGRWDWMSWEQWFLEMGMQFTTPLKTLSFNSYPLLIDGTLHKQGIGLGWGGLVDDLLEKGKLVRLFEKSLKTERGYYLLKPSRIRLTPQAKTLYDWVLKTAASQ
jgi:DNA-binding transcriptional LysR family regulator